MSLEASLHVGLGVQMPIPAVGLAGVYFYSKDTQELYLCDGTQWSLAPLSVVFGASGSGHCIGMVPDAGATSGAERYLREDAVWASPPAGGNAYRQSIDARSTNDLSIAATSYAAVPATFDTPLSIATAGSTRLRVRLCTHGFAAATSVVQFHVLINGVAYSAGDAPLMAGYGGQFVGQIASAVLPSATYPITLEAQITNSSYRLNAATYPDYEGIWISVEEVG